jgi:hypothetical protein
MNGRHVFPITMSNMAAHLGTDTSVENYGNFLQPYLRICIFCAFLGTCLCTAFVFCHSLNIYNTGTHNITVFLIGSSGKINNLVCHNKETCRIILNMTIALVNK